MFRSSAKQPLLTQPVQKFQHYKALKHIFYFLVALITLYFVLSSSSKSFLEASVGGNVESNEADPQGLPPDQQSEVNPAGGAAGPSNVDNEPDKPYAATALELPAEAQQDAGASQNNGAPCNDLIDGYEAQFGVCSRVRVNHIFRRTYLEYTYIPMVVDNLAKCKGERCTIKEKHHCCSVRQSCLNHYAKDVPGGCPASKFVNPYAGAFCKTKPCTSSDEKICCIGEGEVFQRTEGTRSGMAKVAPHPKAKKVVPHFRVGQDFMIWANISAKVKVGNDEWVPLVNFMSSWGEGKGWQGEAWIKYSKAGKIKYAPVQLTEGLPAIAPPGPNAAQPAAAPKKK